MFKTALVSQTVLSEDSVDQKRVRRQTVLTQ